VTKFTQSELLSDISIDRLTSVPVSEVVKAREFDPVMASPAIGPLLISTAIPLTPVNDETSSSSNISGCPTGSNSPKRTAKSKIRRI
jgi:hypothetical protein